MFADRALDLMLRKFTRDEIEKTIQKWRGAARELGLSAWDYDQDASDPTVPELPGPPLVRPWGMTELEMMVRSKEDAIREKMGGIIDITIGMHDHLAEKAKEARRYPFFNVDVPTLLWARDHIPRDPTMLGLPYPVTVLELSNLSPMASHTDLSGDDLASRLIEVSVLLFVDDHDLHFWVIAHGTESYADTRLNLHSLLRFGIPLAEAIGEPDPIPPHGRVEFQMLNAGLVSMKAPMPSMRTALRMGVDCGLGFLSLVNLRRGVAVGERRPQCDPKTQGRRVKNGMRPLLDFHVLDLDPTLESAVREGPGVGTGRSHRQHWCRGHFKKRSTGVFWWSAHLRGKAEDGIVEKEYQVGPRDESGDQADETI